jgi:TonB family protein
MTKEFLISLSGHGLLVMFLSLITAKSPLPRKPPARYEVFMVELRPPVSLEPGEDNLQVIDKTPKISKVSKKIEKKPSRKLSRESRLPSGNLNLKMSSKGTKQSYYIEQMINKISSNWENPAKNSQVALSCVINFTITKDGLISNVKIEKSSGNSAFDFSAQRAVVSTKQLPPFAGEFLGLDSLIVHLEFEQTD